MIFEPDAPPQYAEHGFGDELAVALPEIGMRAEKTVQHRVGRLRHRQHARECCLRCREVGERRVGLYRDFLGARFTGGG